MRDGGNRKLVSIIIPCYNAEEYVGEAIESALDQTYEPKEIIVIDDGSTDSSLDIIRSFGGQITWQTGQNQGACHARNWGLRLAHGEFVKFLDADDILLPSIVATQVKQSRRFYGCRTVVYGDLGKMDKDGRNRHLYPHQPLQPSQDRLAHLLGNNIQTPRVMHRRRLLREVGGFDEGLSRYQEYDLHLRMALAGIHFHYESALVGFFRHHDSTDRIGSQDFINRDPLYELRYILHCYNLIAKSDVALLSGSVKQAIAQRIWRTGRQVLREGFTEESRLYFHTADKLGSKGYRVGSFPYRILALLSNPVIAERIASLYEDIRSHTGQSEAGIIR